MTAQVWRSVEELRRYADFDDNDETDYTGSGELVAGERIGGPPASKHSGSMKRGGIAIAIVLGGSWLAFNHPEFALGWLPDAPTSTSPPLATKAAGTPALDQAPALAPLASVEIAAPPGTDPSAQATAPATETAAQEHAANAAPSGPTDPLAKRAAAAGLHPELSQALLSKLSSADYANAAFAIKTALAQTPDTEVFVHPRERGADVAVFEIRFVPGAEPGCRRYVVEIAKDRWATTALPVENCSADIKPPTH